MEPQDACHQLDDLVRRVFAGVTGPGSPTVAQAEAIVAAADDIAATDGRTAQDSPVPAVEHDLLELIRAIGGMNLDRGLADDLVNHVGAVAGHLVEPGPDAGACQRSPTSPGRSPSRPGRSTASRLARPPRSAPP